jgi:hypothetical protein
MALRPDTPETRMVPVAGRQFAERRLMRGVGAKERAVGNAWSRLNSRQRQYYGNQRNFAGSMQEVANRRAVQAEQDREEQLRAKGREMANNSNGAAQPTNHATRTIKPETERFIQNEVDKDMHPEGKPSRPDGKEALRAGIEAGRVGWGYETHRQDSYPDDSPTTRRRAKGYQMHSLAQARMRGQFNRNPALVADSRRY